MDWIENHCHLSDPRLFADAERWVSEACNAGVNTFVLAGVEPDEWRRQLVLRTRVHGPRIFLNFGLHPWWAERFTDSEIERSLEVLSEMLPLADGLGETGLDFGKKRDPSRFLAQESAFRAQLRLAKKLNKPLMLHVVRAHERAVTILKEEAVSGLPLVIHSYSGNATQLEEYLKLGAFLSYSGSIVPAEGYEKTKRATKRALEKTPLNRVFFETDSPDQTWDDAELNFPARVAEVYQAGAKILGVGLDALAAQVSENFNQIYQARTKND